MTFHTSSIFSTPPVPDTKDAKDFRLKEVTIRTITFIVRQNWAIVAPMPRILRIPAGDWFPENSVPQWKIISKTYYWRNGERFLIRIPSTMAIVEIIRTHYNCGASILSSSEAHERSSKILNLIDLNRYRLRNF